MGGISKVTTIRTRKDIDNYKNNYDMIFKKKKRIAVTFEHNHSTYSDKWREYYSQFVDDIKIINANDQLVSDWGATYPIMNDIQEELFKDYGMIIFADIDEFLVPTKYKDLGEYLDNVESEVIRCTGYNVMEMPEDKPIDFSKSIMSQRTHWSPDEMYNKYVILTKPQHYSSNHHIDNTQTPDKELIMLHLRDADLTSARERLESIGRTLNESDLEYRRSIATKIPTRFRSSTGRATTL